MSGFVYWGKFKRDDDELARVFENAPRTGETGSPLLRAETWIL